VPGDGGDEVARDEDLKVGLDLRPDLCQFTTMNTKIKKELA
jgi:hypothetical protein